MLQQAQFGSKGGTGRIVKRLRERFTYQFKLDTVAVLVERESGFKFYLHAPLPA